MLGFHRKCCSFTKIKGTDNKSKARFMVFSFFIFFFPSPTTFFLYIYIYISRREQAERRQTAVLKEPTSGSITKELIKTSPLTIQFPLSPGSSTPLWDLQTTCKASKPITARTWGQSPGISTTTASSPTPASRHMLQLVPLVTQSHYVYSHTNEQSWNKS